MRRFVAGAVKLLALSVVVLLVVAASYVAMVGERLFPLPHTVVVYGSQSGPGPQQLLAGLEQRGVPYEFAGVEAPLVSWEMRWKFGADWRRLRLPLVQVLGNRHQQPDAELIAIEHQQALRQNSHRRHWPLQRVVAAVLAALAFIGLLVAAIAQRRNKPQRR